jgi:hypothetical protein
MQGTNTDKHSLYTHNAWTRTLRSNKTYNSLTKQAMHLRPTGGKTKQNKTIQPIRHQREGEG